MKDQPGFCYEIYKNISFRSDSNGIAYGPCSFFKGEYDKNVSIEQAWNGAGRNRIINLVATGAKVPNCIACYQQETNNKISRRQSSTVLYETFIQDSDIDIGPTGLDYSIGNLCNLKCMICNPQNSSSWISDYQKIYPDRDVSHFVSRKSETLEIEDDSILQNIKSVHFHGGGEPLLSDAHIRLLEKINRVKGLADVRVFYNTNATVKVDDSVLELWSKCRLIELYFSIDDVGARFEYQRTGANWNTVCDNIKWYYNNMPHNHMFNVNCVWSYLNLFYLDQLVDWHQTNLPSNRYGDQCNLIFQRAIGNFNITHVNSSALSALKNKFKHYPILLSLLSDLTVSDQPHYKFWQAVNQIDQVRQSQFTSMCPEWSAVL
ncbi:twitch domain-containing radical SAM protein [bacterium]|nr:twitch domain-containing radical SAM protein [bacterium]